MINKIFNDLFIFIAMGMITDAFTDIFFIGLYICIAVIIVLLCVCIGIKYRTFREVLLVAVVFLVIWPFLLIYVLARCCCGLCKERNSAKSHDVEAGLGRQYHRVIDNVFPSRLPHHHGADGNAFTHVKVDELHNADTYSGRIKTRRNKSQSRASLQNVHNGNTSGVHRSRADIHNTRSQINYIETAPDYRRGRATTRNCFETKDIDDALQRNTGRRCKSNDCAQRSLLANTVYRDRDQSLPGNQSRVSRNQRGKAFPGQIKVAKISNQGKTIDLHQLSLQDATLETLGFLKQNETEYDEGGYRREDRFLNIITGQGKHSKGGKPVLKPEVEKMLQTNGFVYSVPPNNPGKVVVDLWKSQNRLMA